MIPSRLVRTVPAHTPYEIERYWDEACLLHPDWAHVTHRDPIDPALFPITAGHWPSCATGAQLAGLLRLEDLWHHGGIYLDSDVELYRPLDTLLDCQAFAGYEDPGVIPDAVLGARPGHPAIRGCLDLALARLHGDGTSWTDDRGAWSTGPGVTTTLLPGRNDVLLLPPGSFFPVHYTDKHLIAGRARAPWEFGIHHWAASWVDT